MKPVELPPAPYPDPLTDPLSLAVILEMSERGYAEMTVSSLVARAGTSRGDFEQHYRDLEHCVLDTYERLVAWTAREVGGAFNRGPDWRSAIRAAAYTVAGLLEEHPYTARFGFTEILRMENEMARVRREEVFVFCAGLVERGREEAADPAAIPEGAGLFATGSVIQLLTHRLQEGHEIDYRESARESLFGVVRAYLGEEAAREELSIELPPRRRAVALALG